MSDSIIYALIVGGLTSIHVPAFSEGDKTKRKAALWLWAKKFFLFTLSAALFHYFLVSPSSQSVWFGGTYILVVALLFVNYWMDGGDVPFLGHMCLLISLISASCGALLSDKSAEKVALIGPIERVSWSKTPPPLRLEDTPLVREEQAFSRGVKILGEKFGHRYQLGSFSLQRVNGTNLWVAPVTLKGSEQSSSGGDPASIIIVDAGDPSLSGRVISRDSHGAPVRMSYTPQGSFSRNLIRHINSVNGFLSFAYTDVHLEVDDSYKPWWVISGYRSVDESTFKEKGSVLLVDPETGAVSRYTPDTLPDWVDVAFPAKDAAERLKNWGTLSSGWGANFVGSPHLVAPTIINGRSVWVVKASDGRSLYYAGLMHHNVRFGRLNAFTLTDTRSGETIEYPLEGASGVTPIEALQAVNKKLSSYQGLSATTPLVCSIGAHPVYVVSIIDENSVFKKVALVDTQSDIIALGDDKASALKEFQSLVKRTPVTTL